MQYAIKTKSITKVFTDFRAVDNVSLEVPAGSVFGYLGANGAGKTTTIRILLNLIRANKGSVYILGKKIPSHFNSIASRIGIVPGEVRMYEELSGLETLEYFQRFLKSEAPLRNRLTTDLKLSGRDLAKKVRHYSQGMKQKLLLIQAMQHDPDLLILDEPSERLDPLIQQILYDYIAEFKKRGKTVFFSSHNLPEVEKICDHIGIIKDGRLLVQDKIEHLKKKLPRKVRVLFNEKYVDADFNQSGMTVIKSSDRILEILVEGELQKLMTILKAYNVNDLEFPESSLESFFMNYYRDGENGN